MAIFQFVTKSATGLRGKGDLETVACKAWYFGLGLKIPCWLLVTIVGLGRGILRVGATDWACGEWAWLIIGKGGSAGPGETGSGSGWAGV
ncbi:hypothetical protein Scep_012363 [Stephania cephalantha]|uniref:Uncharacterized protein n=1 Tax=Stephania cephalantha TaxID=152367 RepID=A0AAP0P9G3_9MAGN